MGRDILTFGSKQLTLPPNDLSSPIISCKIWPASLSLCQYLFDHPEEVLGKRVLDMGAGTGIASVLAGVLGARSVVMQEMPGEENAFEMQKNFMKVNVVGEEIYSALQMKWGEFPEGLEPFDLIISSDTFYEPAHFEPLIASVAWFLRQNPACRFITAYHDRDAEYYIGDTLRLWGLEARLLKLPKENLSASTTCRALLNCRDSEEWPLQQEGTIFLVEIRLS